MFYLCYIDLGQLVLRSGGNPNQTCFFKGSVSKGSITGKGPVKNFWRY